MGTYKGFIDPSGEVFIRGVNFESKLILHQIHGNKMVVKWKGGSHWAALGQRGHHVTTLMVWRIDKMWVAKVSEERTVIEFETTSIVEDINVRSTDADIVFEQAKQKAEKMSEKAKEEA